MAARASERDGSIFARIFCTFYFLSGNNQSWFVSMESIYESFGGQENEKRMSRVDACIHNNIIKRTEKISTKERTGRNRVGVIVHSAARTQRFRTWVLFVCFATLKIEFRFRVLSTANGAYDYDTYISYLIAIQIRCRLVDCEHNIIFGFPDKFVD